MNLPEGTIFRFTNPEARSTIFVEGEWDQLCVALFDGEIHCCDGNYRRLSSTGSHGGRVESLPLQSIEIVGLMLKSSKGATKWDDSFAFPHGMTPGTVFQFKTKPKWWYTECDWTTRMVVLFPIVGSGNVHFRRMPKDYPYTSVWNPTTSDEFEIVGHLTPDQLYVTDSTVGIKPEVAEETVDEAVEAFTFPKVVDPRFTEGTVFRLTGKKPDWWHAEEDEWDKPCVVIDLEKSHNGAVPLRRLLEPGVFDSYHFFPEVDAFEIIGQLPSGKLDSIDLGDVRQSGFFPVEVEPAQQLALGTKFRFNKIPERWGSSINVKIEEVFSVIEHSGFTGVGQCVAKTVGPFKDGWWSASDGVLPTDDISIVVDEPEKLALGTKFRFTSRPDRWVTSGSPLSLDTVFKVVEYKCFDGEGQAVQREAARVPWCSVDGVLPSDDIEIFEDELEKLPLGMRFSFRTFPSRWTNDMRDDSSTVFEVIEHKCFDGEGQCITKIGGTATWYHRIDGVLSSDDIVSIEEVEEDKPAQHKTTSDGWEIEQSSGRWSARREDGTYVCGEDLSVVIEAVITRLKHHQKREVERLVTKIQDLERENSQLVGSIDDALADVIAQRNQNERLEKQLQGQKKMIDSDTEVNGRLCVGVDSLRKRVKELEKENGALGEVNKTLVKNDELRITRLKHQQKQEVERLKMKIQELEKDNGELKGTATNWRDTAKRLEKENGQLKGSLADSMASYYAAHRTIKKLSEKKPNGVLAFVKKIW